MDTFVPAVGSRGDLVVVGHSLGGFTAPLACARVPSNSWSSYPLSKGAPREARIHGSVAGIRVHLVSNAGLVTAAALAQRIGLGDLDNQRLRLACEGAVYGRGSRVPRSAIRRSAGAARGAKSFLTETVSRVRGAGATGQLTVRAGSAFYSRAVLGTAVKLGSSSR